MRSAPCKPSESGDSPIKMVVPGLLEKSRRREMDGRRKFITVNNHAAVKIGDLEKEAKSKKKVKPKFKDRLPGSRFSGRSGRAHLASA